MKPNSYLLAIVVALALLGVADSTYLTILKVQDEVQGKADSAVCDAVSATGCSIALESPMSSIGSVPVSLIGGVTYLVVLVLVAFAWGGPLTEYAVAALQWIALGAVIYSLVLAGYSYAQDSWCPFCVGLYFINLGLLVATTLIRGGLGKLGSGLAVVFGARRAALGSIVGFAVAIWAGQWAYAYSIDYLSGDRLAKDRQRVRIAYTTGRYPMPLSADAPSRGPADARLTMVKFSDFECPHCRRMWEQVEEYAERNPDDIRIVFRHHPLNDGCNPMMSHEGHKRACAAAVAAECAHRQEKFWEMGSALFHNQHSLSDADIQEYAKDIGLDMGAFRTCQEDPAALASIRRDALLARSLAAAGTPSSLLNGYLFVGGMSVASVASISNFLAKRERETGPAPINAAYIRMKAGLDAGLQRHEQGPHALTPRVEAAARVTAVIDPGTPEGRLVGLYTFGLQRLHESLVRADIRVLSPSGCGAAVADASELSFECRAARLLMCGLQRGPLPGQGVIKMLGQLEDGTPEEAAASLAQLQAEAEAELGGFDTCMIGAEVGQSLAADAASARTLGVDRGPTVFINGYRWDGTFALEEIDQFLAGVLLAAGE